MKLIVKTLAGLEDVLAEEIRQLGGQLVEPVRRAVLFEGDQRLLYRANLELRTALRVLVPIENFQVQDEENLYRHVRRIDWSRYMSVDDTLAVNATVNSPHFRHSKYVALKVKDGIVDRFRQDKGRRPNVDVESPTLRVNIHIFETDCTVSLDSSGESLHKRGYRTDALEAPINEVLAAGMILLTGWQRDCAFIDPMCGSGTILIEAATYAHGMAPQLHRRHFGFMRWPSFTRSLWEEVLAEARQRIRPFPHGLYGYDKDFRAIKVAQRNSLSAHLEGKVMVERKAFERLVPPEEEGLMAMNPPYDERMVKADIGAFYQMIGDRLKQAFPGYEAWILSSNREALKQVGLRPSQKKTLYNGALECKFHKYELYKGSRKSKNQENE